MSASYEIVRDTIYGHRPVAGITSVTLHYTAGSPSDSPGRIAAIQLDRDAAPGIKFPGLAYTYIVDSAGAPYKAWDLDVRVWHSAAPGKNSGSIGICYTGNVEPNAAQIRGLRACIFDASRELGRSLPVTGHKDDYATECPGPAWPAWKNAVAL